MRKATIFFLFCFFLLPHPTSFATLPADIDASQDVDLRDIITGLQVLAGLPPLPYDYLLTEADINGDDQIGLAEVLAAFEIVSESRTPPTFYFPDRDGDGYSTGASLAAYETPTEFHFPEADLISPYGDVDDEDPDIHPDLTSRWIPFSNDFPEPADPSVIHETGPNDIFLRYRIHGISVTDAPLKDGNYQRVSIGTDVPFHDVPGEPQTPFLKHFVAVPFGAEVELTIDEAQSEYEEFADFRIRPAPHAYPEIIDPPQLPFVKDESIYGTDAFFPKTVVSAERAVIRGVDTRLIQVNPVQYNPVTGITRVYKEIVLTASHNGEPGAYFQSPRFRCPPYDRILQRTLLNGVAVVPQPITRLEVNTNLLIITHSDFLSSANTLKSWKIRKGYDTVVRTEADTGTSAADIQAYIQDAYDTWDLPPAYVLIIGDAEYIPPHYQTDHGFYFASDVKVGTDLYYATVHGADDVPDIALGRLSVDTADEAMARVEAIIGYERSPTTNESYYRTAAICGQFQHDVNGYAERRFAQTSEDLALFLTGHNYGVDRFYRTPSDVDPQHWKRDSWNFKGYAGSPGGGLPTHLLRSNGFSWDADNADISGAVNEGRFLVTHRDHGSTDGWGTPAYSVGDVQDLENGDMRPVVLSINCETGWFDNETDNAASTDADDLNFSEAWERNPNGGAVGVIAASRVSYSGHNDRLVWGWTDAIWPDFIPTFGASTPIYEMGQVLNYGKYYYIQKTSNSDIRKWETEMFHWFGDPTMEIWTDVPFDLHIVQAAKAIEGNSRITIALTEPDALIVVTSDGEAIGKALSAGDGEKTVVPLDRPLAAGEGLAMTITKHNYRPYETTVQVLPRADVPALLSMADIGEDRIASTGEPVPMELVLPFEDAEASDDVDTVTYSWSLQNRPGDSLAEMVGDGRSARFTPDIDGLYTVRATIRADGREHHFERNVVAGETRQGGLIALPGLSGTVISDATFDFFAQVEEDDAELSLDPELNQQVARTEVDVEFLPEATAGQANAVLDEVGGGIVAMIGRTDSFLIRIPDPGDIAGLNEVIAKIESMDGVGAVDKSVVITPPKTDPEGIEILGPTPRELPSGITAGDSTDMPRTNHHLAIRGHGAWNMKNGVPGSVNDRPWLVIGDFFGDGEPDGDYAAVTRSGDFANFGPGGDEDDCEDDESCKHGYHVLGIILGLYGDSGPGGTARDDVTGIFPTSMRVRAVDLADKNRTGRTRRKLVRRMKDIVNADANARIVVNTSIGHSDPDGSTDPNEGPANRHARKYAKALRRNNLVNSVVHATSAGNASFDDDGNLTNRWPSRLNSGYAYATLGDITGFLGADVAELDNILVVENRTNSSESSSSRPTPQCLGGGSLFSGNISGIGSGVYSFGSDVTDSSGDELGSDSQSATYLSGTSMASPQLAGVAAYAWAMDTSRKGPDLVNLLIGLARSDYVSGCTTTPAQPQPVVDAFDAVRAAGGADAQRALNDAASGPSTAGNDGTFDADDIRFLLNQWAAGANLDYGRYDLNGDGWTDGAPGSGNTEPVDLNGDGSRGTVQQTLEGFQRNFDETSVSDLDVLCYDAYGAAYAGSTTDRNRLLGQLCGIVDVDILKPSAGDAIEEGTDIDVEADIVINGPHNGAVTLHTGGSEVDSDPNWQYTYNFPVSLHTREVCPSDPTLTVRFEDSTTGLFAEDTVKVAIAEAPLDVFISGRDPRYVRVHPGPYIDPMDFEGKGVKPTCVDPFSDRLNQGNLTWLDDGDQPLRDANGNPITGTQLTLEDDYLDADGDGVFTDRRVGLEFTRDGSNVYDRVLIKPCSSDLGTGDAVSGYPECPSSAVIGDIYADLAGTFGVDSLSELEERINQIINGVPAHVGVLEDLGREPCDPTHCDPAPPGYPYGRAEIVERMTIEEYNPTVIDYMGRMFDAIDNSADPETARRELQAVAAEAGGDETLLDPDRSLLRTAYSATVAALDYFAPEEQGGANGWETFMTEEEQEAFHSKGNLRRPARGALAGCLTAVIDAGVRNEFEGSQLLRDSAAYGAALGAGEEYLAFKGK